MADLNPADAKRLQIRQDDRIAVESAHGTIKLYANLTQAVEQLETNQTGTIQLLREDRYAANFIPGTR